ncbi:GNAT family N-acetyltransferase [Nocardia arizonensis]|uniref:GNAT family N-acetyltransferase n=1 Tax=Nocardia arizonensis TaxID=1141647 RepID=UPI0009EBD41C|nr:GNAT family N-acetyltransferase [Nocardia arizonensis]
MPHRADPLRPDSLRLTEDDLSNPALRSLLDDHLREMRANSPEGSMHALDPAAPRDPAVTFWSAWEDRDLVGCGALEQLDAAHGEIKSMRTASGHTRRGVATAVLTHLVTVARVRGYRRLSLETGAAEHYRPAVRLYERHGFTICAPFGDYAEDPHSIFMALPLT